MGIEILDPYEADYDALSQEARDWRDELDYLDPNFGDIDELSNMLERAPEEFKGWMRQQIIARSRFELIMDRINQGV